MKIKIKETIEDVCATPEDAIQHPKAADGSEVAPFDTKEQMVTEDMKLVHNHYKLKAGETYTVADKWGKRLVDQGFATKG